MPPAIVALRAHIESSAPDAWKASVRVLELAFSRTDDAEEFRLPTDPAEIAAMSWTHMRLLAMQLTAPMLEDENGPALVERIGSNQ